MRAARQRTSAVAAMLRPMPRGHYARSRAGAQVILHTVSSPEKWLTPYRPTCTAARCSRPCQGWRRGLTHGRYSTRNAGPCCVEPIRLAMGHDP